MAQTQVEKKSTSWIGWGMGIGLTVLIAYVGIWSSEWIGTGLLGFDKSPISGIMMAILLGLVVGNSVLLPPTVKRGVTFSVKIILRLGIILLGIRLGLGDVFRLGLLGVPLIILCVGGALLLSGWLGARLNLPPRMSALIAVGTSICGATAIVAIGPAIEAKDEEIMYAVANITIFGMVAMFLYPYLAHVLFAQNPTSAGLFLGTAIHETAQVAGSGLIYSQLYNAPQALEAATITKLVRNIFMVLVIPLMAYRYRVNEEGSANQQIRWASLFPMFILGFVLMALIRTIGDATLSNGMAYGVLTADQWHALTRYIQEVANFLLAIAMAAVGLGTRLSQLRGLGLKPFYVGFGAAVIVGSLSVVGILLLQLFGLTLT